MCEQRAIFEDILKRIQNTIDSETPKDDDCISLYDVAQLIIDKYNQYEDIRKLYRENLEEDMEGKVHSIVVYNFDYKKNEMGIGISTKLFGDYNEIRFLKYNGDLFVSYSEVYNDIEVMGKCGNTLSKMYDEFEALRGFKTQFSYEVNTLNSKFLVDISNFGVEIHAGNRYVFDYDFELSLMSYKCEYECKCNSCNIVSTVQGNEEKIFRKVFVKIEDCPEWAQPILHEIRQEQLAPKPKNFLEENNSRPRRGILSVIKEYFKDMYRLLNGEEI